MSDLAEGFASLPPEHQAVLHLAQEQHNIEVIPLQKLSGGRTGAILYLASVLSPGSVEPDHVVLKLDRARPGKDDEGDKHRLALREAPPDFAREHMAELAFDKVETQESLAIFYAIAGESLLRFRPLAAYESQRQLETIFGVATVDLLTDWNASSTFEQAVHPQHLLADWLGSRLEPGGRIERFLEEVCGVPADTAGLLVGGAMLPNPLAYAREKLRWGEARPIDAISGFEHGDLNVTNLLVKFDANGEVIEDYYLIDLALFKSKMPLLFDHCYLEMSYLVDYVGRVPFARWVDMATGFSEQDIPDAQQAAAELAGASAVIGAGRSAFEDWLQAEYPSLSDDLWGQRWLAGVAAGLNFCNKAALPDRERLAGLIYAAAHLKRYATQFGVPLPTEAAYLYDASQAEEQALLQPTSRETDHLPIQLTPFVGREAELAELADMIADSERRLVTVVGPGGIGKTSLAIEAARDQIGNFRQGVFFVPLAPLDSGEQIMQAISQALGLSFVGEADLKETLLQYLGNRHLLLVMDNFEHLTEGATLVTDILEGAGKTTILATSREKLNLRGETVYNLAGLAFAHWRTPEEALADSAAQLFEQSARRARPDYRLGQDDVHAVAHICQMVEAMPLGIMLAAAWLDVLSPEEIRAEIGQSMDFLETELRDVPARQRSIRAVFETSWERLAQDERDLFKRLSVFRGGFTREGAQEVAGASIRQLAGLANKSFLWRDPDSGRYEVHELLRQYGAERLEGQAESGHAAHEAHAAYFADLMQQRSGELTSGQHRVAMRDTEDDIENIRKAWRYWVAAGNVAEVRKFIDALWLFHEALGWNHAADELFGVAEATLPAATGDDDSEAVIAQILAARSWFVTQRGLPQQGYEMAQESLEALRRLGRREDMLLSLVGVTSASTYLHRLSEVIEMAGEAVEVARETGQRWWEARAMLWQGAGYIWSQSFGPRDAEQIATEAGAIMAEIGLTHGAFWPPIMLGLAAMTNGEYEKARQEFQLGLETAQATNFRRGFQIANENMGNIAYALGELGRAQEHYRQSLAISDETGQVRETLAALYEIARVRTALDEYEEAIELLAMVLRHPASGQHSLAFLGTTLREAADQLRAELEAELGAEAYEEAWRRGQSLELEAVVAHLIERGTDG